MFYFSMNFSFTRTQTLTRLRLLAHVFVGLLIGLLYFNIGNQGTLVINNAAFIFFSVLFIMFSSLMPTVMTFFRICLQFFLLKAAVAVGLNTG
ncbi:unnamed protein product [Dibothriocephalus latus]|uniref:ABC-2 type transporter transmembrane domain-containing protein n=1 Tax=Dibothriocephalus latus TaxID=60516 RepID=A0A3P7LM35_DIBLA|nr:unnamed protein product [Dibothriocephalus latus]